MVADHYLAGVIEDRHYAIESHAHPQIEAANLAAI
jgi:hypothetical protein